MHGITHRWRQDAGATSAEYVLIASLLAVVVLASVALLGTSVGSLFDKTADSVTIATNP